MSNIFVSAMDFLKTPVAVGEVSFSMWGIFCTFFAVYLLHEIVSALKGGK